MTTRTMARFGMQSRAVRDSICQALEQGHGPQEMRSMRNTVAARAGHSFSTAMDMSQDSNSQHDRQSDMGGMGGSGGGAGGGIGGGMGGTGGGTGGGMGGGRM